MIVSSGAYFDMIARKAGALAGCAAEAGALAAGAAPPVCEQFREMGSKLGMAWQITQDVTDLWGAQGDAMTASNVLNKKKSLPLIRALEVSDVAAKRNLGSIYMQRVLEPEDVSRLLEILDRSDARQYSQAKAAELSGQAMECLSGIDLVDHGFEALSGLAQRAWAGEP
jgi:geranylgeranyl diphosphate synthase type I